VKLPECVQRKVSSVFSETPANYEAFCQMKIKNLEFKYQNDRAKEKFKNRQRTLKKYQFNI
jgi:hypothetical protein